MIEFKILKLNFYHEFLTLKCVKLTLVSKDLYQLNIPNLKIRVRILKFAQIY